MTRNAVIAIDLRGPPSILLRVDRVIE